MTFYSFYPFPNTFSSFILWHRNSYTYEKPVFLVYASKEDRDAVGQKLLELVKKDIHYEEDRIQKTLEYQMQSSAKL